MLDKLSGNFVSMPVEIRFCVDVRSKISNLTGCIYKSEVVVCM